MQLQSGLLYSSELSQVDHGSAGPDTAVSLRNSVNRVNLWPQELFVAADVTSLLQKVAVDESLCNHASRNNLFRPEILFSQESTSTAFSSMQSLLSGVPSSINYNMKLLENVVGMKDSHLIDAAQPMNDACARSGDKGLSFFLEDKNTYIREQLTNDRNVDDRFTGNIGSMGAPSLATTFSDMAGLDMQPSSLEPLKYLTESNDTPLNSFTRFAADEFSLDTCLLVDSNQPILKPNLVSSIFPKRFSGVEKGPEILPSYQPQSTSHSGWRPELLDCLTGKDLGSDSCTSTAKFEDGEALNFSENGFDCLNSTIQPLPDSCYRRSIHQSNTFQVIESSTSSPKLVTCELPVNVNAKETQRVPSSSLYQEQSDLLQNGRGYLHTEKCAGLIEERDNGELGKPNKKSSAQISEVDLEGGEDELVATGCGNATLHDGNERLMLEETVPVQASIVSPGPGKGKKGLPAKNLHAERRRRKKLNERLYLLRSVVPKISKMDRASILGDAIDYLKELLQQINDLQRELKSPPSMDSATLPCIPIIGMDNHSPSIGACIKEEFSSLVEEPVLRSPKVEVNTKGGKAFDIHMVCSTQPGLLLATVQKLDELGLDIQQAVVSCFNGFSLDIFRAEQHLDKDFQPEDIKSALLQTVACEQGKAFQHS